jgi:sugar O-acyltransferase (sialic acid O-acetyltransferase NeuD family)
VTRPLVIYGARTRYAAELAEIAQRAGYEVALVVDNLESGPDPCPVGPVVRPDALTTNHLALDVAVPLLTPGHRRTVVEEARSLGFHRFPSIVDPTAVVARSADLGEGTIVNAGVVIAAAAVLGRFVQVNRSASIGHDNRIASWCSVGPGATLAGSVVLEEGAFLGAGAVVAPEVRVGPNTVVGAGAVCVRDVDAHSVVVGNPARALRTSPGYGGVSV